MAKTNMAREENMNEEKIRRIAIYLAFLEKNYPAGVPRCKAVEASGGLVSAKTLANLSCTSGDVPVGEYLVRGRVTYSNSEFARWLFAEKNDEDTNG